MKLKFRADTKDVIIFLAFTALVFILISLAVSNVGLFISEGEFAGFTIIPAITKYFWFTMMLFIIAIIAMFMSVQSWFFEREEGIGLQIGEKKEKNYSRWEKDKEMKKGLDIVAVDPLAPKTEAAGIPIIMTPKQVWVDNGGYHNLVIGSTGAGKTQTTVLPMVNLLAKHDESMIITDPKGEIYEDTSNYLRSLGYNIVLLNFRDPQQGNSWNPMYLPYSLYKDHKIDKSIELLEDLAANILKDPSAKGQDPFWENTSADYFAGLAISLFEDGNENQINLNSINLMTTIGEEKLANTTYIKEYFSFKDPASTAYIKASSTLMAPNETKGSIISVFKQKIKLFASRDNLSEMLSHSDFDLKTIGEQPTALFIVIQDEKKTYHSLVTILLKQCYETLISVAQEHGGKLPVRTNFLLDEFANMPPLKDITTMITAARSRQVRFTMIIQNFAQLDQVYGKENAETIKGNCGNIIYLITTELKALEEISKMCGEVKSKKDDKTASTPLVTISELQRMKQFEVIIMRIRQAPFKTKFTPDYKMKWDKDYPKATYPEREKQEVHTFDIREYVKEKKKEKLMEMMNNPQGASGGVPGGMAGMPGMAGMSGMGGMGGMSGMNRMPGMPGMPGMNGMQSMPPRPNGNGMSNSSRLARSGFNVDDLVKKIDEKIAQIEAEEKRQRGENPVPTEKPKTQEAVVEPVTKTPLPVPDFVKETPVTKDNFDKNMTSGIQSIFEEPSVTTSINRTRPVENETKMSTNDLLSGSLSSPKPTSTDIPKTNDMDDFVAQFQEKKEAPSVSSKTTAPSISTIQNTTNSSPQPSPAIVHEDKIIEKEIEVTDDQFFDDFFDD